MDNTINSLQIKFNDSVTKKTNLEQKKEEAGDAFIKSDETIEEEPKVYFFSKRMISESAEETLLDLGEWISSNQEKA